MKKVISFLCLVIAGFFIYAFAQSDNIPKIEAGRAYETKSVKSDRHSKVNNAVTKTLKLSETKRAKRMASSYSEYLDVYSLLGVENATSIDGWYFPLGETNLWFGQGEGTIPPRYYTTGNTLRMYYGNNLVVYGSSSNVQITSVSFTFYDGKKWTVAPTVNNGSYSTSSNSWSGYTNSLEIISDETVYIQRIDITYTYGESQSTEVVPPLFSYNSSEWNYIGKGEFKDAWFNNVWTSGEAIPYDVDIYQNRSNSNLYLVYNPYNGPDSPYAEINQSSKTGYLFFDITDPECVLVRPSVYAATFDVGDSNTQFYNFNLEAYYYYNDNSYSAIKNHLREEGMSISTYNSSSREISIKNGLFSFEPGLEDAYNWSGAIMEGYLKLPRNEGGGNTENPSLFEYKPSEWSYLGVGEFKDAWLPVFWTTGSAQPYEVPVYRNNTNRNQYLIMNPYGADTPYCEINVGSRNGYILIDVTNPDCVLVRPLVYAATIEFPNRESDFYALNYEGWCYMNGFSYDEIISYLQGRDIIPSSYSPSKGLISLRNAHFTYTDDISNIYYWDADCDPTGYLVLPGFSGGNADTNSSSITVCYLADGKEQSKEINRGSNGMFETEISNLEWFYFIDDNTGSGFAVNLYESNLGADLPTVNYLDTGKPYTYTPWNGTYKLTVSGDLSIAKAETKTSKPSSVSLYLPGSFNDWTFSSTNKFEQSGENKFSYTVPADINGEWKIADEVWRYDYSYSGAVNPNDTYQFAYNITNNTTLPLHKGDVIEVTINRDKYYNPATVFIRRASSGGQQPPTSGSTVEVNGVVYTLYPDYGYFMATDGSKATGNVDLISSTSGLTLKGVAQGAFQGNSLIMSVTLPEGATVIEEDAFRDCINLQEAKFPTTLTSIGKYAFLNCSYLSSLSLPAKVNTLGIGAFQNCSDLESFSFNEANLTAIPDALFEGCGRLQEVVIPSSVTKLGANAFMESGVVKIGVTNAVTIVGDHAFENSQLAQFDFNNVTQIGMGAFKNTNLKAAEFGSTFKTLGAEAFAYCSKLAKVAVPYGLQSISKSAFEGCKALTTFSFPSSITEIWENAFYNSGLVNVELGNNVTQLGANAFVTESLTSITLGSGIASLDKMPLYTNGLLRINNSTPPTLGNDRLGCTPTVIIVPKGSGATYLSNSRWKQYNIIEEDDQVTIYLSAPGALTSDLRIQQKLAAQVTSLKIVTRPENGTLNETDWRSIKSNMTALIKLDISQADVKTIPDECFMGKKILTEIVLPQNLLTIGNKAFEGCALLKSLTLPSSVTSIGTRAFAGCNSMSGKIEIPSNCNFMGEEVFANCFALEEISFKNTVINEIKKATFENCRSLDVVSLPEGLKYVGDRAFAESGITDISIPSTLQEIGNSAFEGCFYLSSIALPNSVREIGARAFAKSGLVGINLPSGISTLEDETFDSCDDLLCVNLPASLKTLGSRSIASPAVSSISSMAQVPPTSSYEPFDGINNYTCTLSIPAFSFNDYISAQYWGSFVGIHDNIDVTITGDEDVTFVDETDYQSLMRSASVKNVKGKLAKKYAKASTINPINFAKLFNGAQMCVPENKSVRFFFNGNINGYKVIFNGQDVTSKIDKNTNSWVSPAMSGSATLQIINSSGVESIFNSGEFLSSDVYDLYGRIVLRNASEEQLNTLAPGIYILNGKKFVVK